MTAEEQRKKRTEYSKAWRAKNIDRARELDRQSYKRCGSQYAKRAEYYKTKAKERRTSLGSANVTTLHCDWRERYPKRYLLNKAKTGARSKGLEFSLTEEDLYIPLVCPILGIDLVVFNRKGTSAANTMSIDRIDSNKGYVPGNVMVISWKANRMKQDLSIDMMKRFIEVYEHQA